MKQGQKMKNSLKKSKGFTLIELIIVIIILGILAVTAAPKFIDIQTDARESVMSGVKGAVESALIVVHTKALLANQTGATGEVTIGTTDIALVYGYPTNASIALAMDYDTNTINFVGDADEATATETAGDAILAGGRFSFDGATAAAILTCNVTYTQPAESGNAPTTSLSVSTC